MNTVFLGTPAFAVPALRLLARTPGISVTAVVCQPDRPAGRKGELQLPAVKLAALELGLPVFQPGTFRDDSAWEWLRAQSPDALVVIAFGQILPRRVFELPKFGAINAHASLLPELRGAAPIQWAIARGATITGVTTMRIDAGLDTGDILLRREVEIGPTQTAIELGGILSDVAAQLMADTLHGLEGGSITSQPQSNADATLAPVLKREDGDVDWQMPAAEIFNRWRGFQPWPGIFTRFRWRKMTIVGCRPLPYTAGAPGTLNLQSGELIAGCGTGSLVLEQVQMEGRKALTGEAFARGARLVPGDALG